MKKCKILAINPGSTSTKIAIFENQKEIFVKNIRMTDEEYLKYRTIEQQFEHRLELIKSVLSQNGFDISDLSCVVGRGGMLPSIKTGGYKVNQTMVDLVFKNELSPHASNLGSVLAYAIAEPLGIPSYIYDAVTSNELMEIATITGFPEVTRTSVCHVLNTRAVGMEYAESVGKKYSDMNLLMVHLGGGITVSAHAKGRIIDSIADDGGPFSPERSGSIRMLDIINLCYGDTYTEEHIRNRVRGTGGLKAYLGTSDGIEIENLVNSGDEKAIKLCKALAYQVAKGVGLTSVTFKGDIDAIVLTGGLAYFKMLVEDITDYVKFIAPVKVIPGEREMEALANGAYRIITGEEEAKDFTI